MKREGDVIFQQGGGYGKIPHPLTGERGLERSNFISQDISTATRNAAINHGANGMFRKGSILEVFSRTVAATLLGSRLVCV